MPFEECGEGFISKDENLKEAERRAEEDALQKAMKKSGMVNQFYGFQDFQAQYGDTAYQSVSKYLYTWTNALAEYERVGVPETVILDTGVKCTVKIKGKIRAKGSVDPSFEIRLDGKSAKLGLSQPSYYDGDEVTLSFWPTRDAYVQVLCIDEAKDVTLIYPTRDDPQGLIKAGEIFTIPNDKMTFKLKAILPPGKKETIEMVQIILTKDQPLFNLFDSNVKYVGGYKQLGIGEVSGVTQRFAKLDQSKWTMMVLPYKIVAR